MKWSLVGLIVAGVVAALCAAVLVAGVQAGSGREARARPSELEVAVAAKALPAGKVVQHENVVSKTMSAEEAPQDALSPADVVGKVIIVPVVEGQVFKGECFATGSSGLRLASALPEGMRAVSVSLENHLGLKGLLYPGSVVDVLASFKTPSTRGARGEAVSVTLLQGVHVLAIDDKTVIPGDGKSGKLGGPRKLMVTLMVDSVQAEALQLAMESGTISLALRNPLDTTSVSKDPTALSHLCGERDDEPQVLAKKDVVAIPEPPAPPQTTEAATSEEPEGWRTIIIRGDSVKMMLFQVPKT